MVGLNLTAIVHDELPPSDAPQVPPVTVKSAALVPLTALPIEIRDSSARVCDCHWRIGRLAAGVAGNAPECSQRTAEELVMVAESTASNKSLEALLSPDPLLA